MKRLNLIGLSGLGLLLAACSASNSAPDGGRPPLPTGVEVRFPAAPANAYLSLLTEDGRNVYQRAVPAGATATEVSPGGWKDEEKNAQDVALLLPAGIVEGSVTANVGDAKARLLRWVMWQDRNTNGTRDDGETLNLMTHDRVAYASQPFTLTFRTAAPNMRQTWQLKAGWSRAEHYVHLPQGTDTYLRSLESNPVQRYTLHVDTPITSQ